MPTRTGYLMVDHRASPGLTEEQARFNCYDPDLAKEGRLFEADTLTCAHCPAIVIKNPERTRERYSCQKCGGHYVCDTCNFRSLQPGYVHLSKWAQIDQKYEAVMAQPVTSFVPSLALKG